MIYLTLVKQYQSKHTMTSTIKTVSSISIAELEPVMDDIMAKKITADSDSDSDSTSDSDFDSTSDSDSDSTSDSDSDSDSDSRF